jgi:hypothetical protein
MKKRQRHDPDYEPRAHGSSGGEGAPPAQRGRPEGRPQRIPGRSTDDDSGPPHQRPSQPAPGGAGQNQSRALGPARAAAAGAGDAGGAEDEGAGSEASYGTTSTQGTRSDVICLLESSGEEGGGARGRAAEAGGEEGDSAAAAVAAAAAAGAGSSRAAAALQRQPPSIAWPAAAAAAAAGSPAVKQEAAGRDQDPAVAGLGAPLRRWKDARGPLVTGPAAREGDQGRRAEEGPGRERGEVGGQAKRDKLRRLAGEAPRQQERQAPTQAQQQQQQQQQQQAQPQQAQPQQAQPQQAQPQQAQPQQQEQPQPDDSPREFFLVGSAPNSSRSVSCRLWLPAVEHGYAAFCVWQLGMGPPSRAPYPSPLTAYPYPAAARPMPRRGRRAGEAAAH